MIELRLFGAASLDSSDPGREREELQALLTQPKRLALLAYLAVATPRGFHRRDRLLGLFWPELDEERARAAARPRGWVLAQRYDAEGRATLAATWARQAVTLAPTDERVVRKAI